MQRKQRQWIKSAFLSALITSVAAVVMPTMASAGTLKLNQMETILVRGFSQAPGSVSGINLDLGFYYDEQLHVDYVDPEYGKSGAARALYEYMRGAPDQRSQWPIKCKQECLLATASTGDLVARVFIENMPYWAAEDGIRPFNILSTIDFVGAGGGTEAANWWLVAGPDAREYLQNTLIALGYEPPDMPFGDAVDDLRPGVARSLATRFHEHRVPRFRISVRTDLEGQLPLGYLNVLAHDTLVPAHSTCGVNDSLRELLSCVDHVGYDGVTHDYGVRLPQGGPSTFGRALWPYHYPVIMASGDYVHTNPQSSTKQGPVTYVTRHPQGNGTGFDFNRNGYANVVKQYKPAYKEYYNCRWSWWSGFQCDSRWVYILWHRKQELRAPIIELVREAFYRRVD